MPSGQYVDQRIVEMRIDNKQFESGAKNTISMLEKLEKALHLKGDTKTLDEMSRAVKKFDASDMSTSLEKVQMSFSALEVAGLRVIQNLTDAVYGFAAKTVKSHSEYALIISRLVTNRLPPKNVVPFITSS